MNPDKKTIPILLVDDSPADIEIIRTTLKKKGISNPIHIARNGEEAIDILHQRFFQAGVLILDIHLPKVNGIEVLKEAKRIDPDAVVIMLTGHASMKTAVEALRREAFDYLKGHLKNIFQKMDVHNRATLVSKVLSGFS